MLFEKTVQRYIQIYYWQCFSLENVLSKIVETVFCYIFAANRWPKGDEKVKESTREIRKSGAYSLPKLAEICVSYKENYTL